MGAYFTIKGTTIYFYDFIYFNGIPLKTLHIYDVAKYKDQYFQIDLN